MLLKNWHWKKGSAITIDMPMDVKSVVILYRSINRHPISLSHPHHYSPPFRHRNPQGGNLKTDGSKYKDESGTLKDGFTRLLDVVTLNNVVEYNFGKIDPSVLLHGIHVVVLCKGDELQYGVDESYKLYVNSKGNPNYAHIEAAMVYGALHAL
ncbi:putative beta-N-acetylhexosaminidase [Helianthus annuus]|nr:putative beta-N-acetylhexosaminidase [Helianthus annuus]KAJ0760661.1 putative beta-N-acetylhexosaminidase [Helianthus annuus]